jgi:hypothetical protein
MRLCEFAGFSFIGLMLASLWFLVFVGLALTFAPLAG